MGNSVFRRKVEVKVRNHADVLVVGGGPAGFGAAIAASRAGARVTLVERGGMLGGMWTLGLLSPYFDNLNKAGLNLELREKLKERNAWGGLWDISFDPAQMAMLLDEYAIEHKLDLILHAVAVETIVEGNVVKGVIVETKSGPLAVTADAVIDCTGDGDVAADAGADFVIGRQEDGLTQPMTMMFKIGGVRDDYPRDDIIGWYNALKERLSEREILAQIPFNYPAIIKLPRPGEALIQWTHVKRRFGTDADDLTAATLDGRRQVRDAMKLLPLIRDVLGDVYLMELPYVIGVRETRRITGDYEISDDDVRSSRTFADGICRVEFGVDIHEPTEKSQTVVCHKGFDIPLRSLLPVGLENIMTAGRCISGSYMAHAAYRVTGDCVATGEAAGALSARAADRKTSPRRLSREEGNQ